MKRTFIAVKVEASSKLSETVMSIRNDLKGEAIKWTDITKMHITLAFIGDTSESTIKDISSMLKDKCTVFGKFDFSVQGIGLFGNIHDPKVIWAGVKRAEKLSELCKSIRTGLDELDISTEEREFKPHLTLGRIKWIKNKKILEAIISENSQLEFQKTDVSEVIYYESILKPDGSLYFPIRTFRLGSTPD